MITPSKFTPLDESILSKLDIIIDDLPSDTSLHELYRATAHRFESADQFILAIDVLYILGRLKVDFRNEVVSPC